MDRVWPCCGCLLSRVLLAFGVSVGLVWFGLVCSVSVCVSVSIDVVCQASGRVSLVQCGVCELFPVVFSLPHGRFQHTIDSSHRLSLLLLLRPRLLVGW